MTSFMTRFVTCSRSLFANVAVLAVMAAGLGACVAPVAYTDAYGYPAYYGYPYDYGYPAYYGYPGYYYGPPAYYAYPAPLFFHGSVFFHSGGGRGHRW